MLKSTSFFYIKSEIRKLVDSLIRYVNCLTITKNLVRVLIIIGLIKDWLTGDALSKINMIVKYHHRVSKIEPFPLLLVYMRYNFSHSFTYSKLKIKKN